MLRTAQFENNMKERLGVAYFIFDYKLCVFTALNSARRGSSINYAEEIIQAICNKEGVDPFCMRFFDLQTRTSYSRGLGKPQSGDFEFDEVLIAPSSHRIQGFLAHSWSLTECPNQVIVAFAAYIDGAPRQNTPREFEAKFCESST